MTAACKKCAKVEDKQNGPCLECDKCEKLVHVECLDSRNTPGNLLGDVFFDYTCAECSPQRIETFKRQKISWLFILALTLYHLSKKCLGISNNGYFHWKTHIGYFITNNWELLFDLTQKRKKYNCGTFSGVLSNWTNIFFVSGASLLQENGWWKIVDGFSPALVKYLYTEFTNWKQKDRKNASLVANDKLVEYNVLKKLLTSLGYENILINPSDLKITTYHETPQNDNEESGICSPKSEAKSPRSEIRSDDNSITSYRGEPSHSDVDDYFSNFLMDCDDNLMNTNFNDLLLDFEDSPDNPHLNIRNGSFSKILHVQKSSMKVNEDQEKCQNVTKKIIIPPPQESLFSNSQKTKDKPWSKEESGVKILKTETHLVTVYTENQMLNHLNSVCRKTHYENIDRKLIRLRAKLALRRLKRNRHLPTFNLDQLVKKYAYYPIQETGDSSSNIRVLDQFHHSSHNMSHMNFALRLITTNDTSPFISPYSGKLLKPFIWRDYDSCPPWIKLMGELETKVNKHNPNWIKKARASLDYCYVRPHHIASINNLCCQFFWPGIDLSDTLLYPEFSCVVLYKKIIIAFAFLVPDVSFNESYLSFIFTRPEWRKCGIASFMLYHLTQTCIEKDITMHVSASNPAVFLYQKFGFKIEEFLQEFYDKYFPSESKECKHAFFLRLSRS